MKMNFNEAVNKFKEDLKGREISNKSAIEFTISNLRSLMDFGEIIDKKTLSDKIKSFEGTHVQFDYIYSQDVKEILREIKEEIDKINKDGMGRNAESVKEYIVRIIDKKAGKRLI